MSTAAGSAKGKAYVLIHWMGRYSLICDTLQSRSCHSWKGEWQRQASRTQDGGGPRRGGGRRGGGRRRRRRRRRRGGGGGRGGRGMFVSTDIRCTDVNSRRTFLPSMLPPS